MKLAVYEPKSWIDAVVHLVSTTATTPPPAPRAVTPTPRAAPAPVVPTPQPATEPPPQVEPRFGDVGFAGAVYARRLRVVMAAQAELAAAVAAHADRPR